MRGRQPPAATGSAPFATALLCFSADGATVFTGCDWCVASAMRTSFSSLFLAGAGGIGGPAGFGTAIVTPSSAVTRCSRATCVSASFLPSLAGTSCLSRNALLNAGSPRKKSSAFLPSDSDEVWPGVSLRATR